MDTVKMRDYILLGKERILVASHPKGELLQRGKSLFGKIWEQGM